MKPYELFVVVQPGLIPFACQELEALGYQHLQLKDGGIFLTGHLSTLIRLNLVCRTVSRVLITLGRFTATCFASLEHRLAALPWQEYLTQQSVCIHTVSYGSKLYHERAVSDRLLSTLSGLLGRPVTEIGSPDAPNTQLIVLHIKHDEVTVRLDSTGAHLHKRGYGLYKDTAPLRSTVAAALLLQTGWLTRHRHLHDPMCGSGTIVLEAALLAVRTPHSAFRTFAFQAWKCFQPEIFTRLETALLAARISHPEVDIKASDLSARAIAITQKNLALAGVDTLISTQVKPVSELVLDKKALVLTNPPWGKRLTNASTEAWLRPLQHAATRGHEVYILMPADRITAPLHPYKEELRLVIGGRDIILLKLKG